MLGATDTWHTPHPRPLRSAHVPVFHVCCRNALRHASFPTLRMVWHTHRNITLNISFTKSQAATGGGRRTSWPVLPHLCQYYRDSRLSSRSILQVLTPPYCCPTQILTLLPCPHPYTTAFRILALEYLEPPPSLPNCDWGLNLQNIDIKRLDVWGLVKELNPYSVHGLEAIMTFALREFEKNLYRPLEGLFKN